LACKLYWCLLQITGDDGQPGSQLQVRGACYHWRMFNFGKPKTAGDWIVHIAGAIVAIFLIWWMLRVYVL
jgi:hypothetical protein